MYTAKQVASYLLRKANDMGNDDGSLSGNNDVTNLKLQKLLYFAQVEHYKKYGRWLFSDQIEAWRYGPVVRKVYDWLHGCGGYVITDFDVDLSEADSIKGDTKEFLDEFWSKYDDYSAWGLVQKTHEAGSPWSRVYDGGIGDKEVIPRELLKNASVLGGVE